MTFAPGTRVKHPMYAGVGTVCNSPGNDHRHTMVSWTQGTAVVANVMLTIVPKEDK